MYVVQYVLLFGAAVLLSIGAFTGRGRGFAAILGIFGWIVVGNASSAVVYYDGAGAQHVATSTPLTWLAYAVAFMHVVALLLIVHDIMTDDSDADSADDLPGQVDPSAGNEPDIRGLQSNADPDKLQP
jgi:hypothetical protein